MGDSLSLLAVGADEPLTRICSRLVRDHDIAVTVSESAEAPTGFDEADCLLVADALLDASGLARVETVRERRPSLPIVALHRSPEEGVRAYEAGVDHCLRLPEDPETAAPELVALLRRLVERRSGRRSRSRSRSRSRNRSRPPDDRSLLGDAIDTLTDVFFVFDLDGNFLRWNSRVREATGYGDDAIAEMHPLDFVIPEHRERVSKAIARAVDEGTAQVEADFLTADGERIPYEVRGALLYDEGDPVAICGTGRDITERKRRERALERQAERLETLNHINAVIRDVNEALVRAETREEIEEAVCEHLAADAPYRFAWIGHLGHAGGVEPRAWAGVEDGYLEERPTGVDEEGMVTARTAIADDRVIVAQNVAADPAFEPWREAALERGFRSAAAIPLTYRNTTYGVLCVYATRSHAFDETERAVLAELGETIAYAISAVEQHRALVSDAVIEIEMGLPSGPFFVAASERIGGEVALEGVVQVSDGKLAEFVTLDGDDGAVEAVEDLATERGGEASLVTEYEGTSVVRVTTPEPSLPELIADHGGVHREASATDGEGRATVELPREADVRSVVGSIRSRYPDAELRAQRERERTSTRGLEFREAFDEALTDRQREVLETAYLAGYFDWPRGSTAEEVAESLGVSAPTFHEHIRRIENKLLSAYFDTNPPVERPSPGGEE